MELQIGKLSAVAIAKKYGTPLYVYDKQIILQKIQDLKDAFPNTNICYAIKANANFTLLKLIAQQGVGADCCNVVEMTLAKEAGFDMSKSVFTTVNPTNKDLEKAMQLGILINLDDISIFPRLLQYGTPQVISFRVNPGFGKGKFNEVNVGGEGSKFGMDEETLSKAYALAKESGIKRFGLHVHTGCIIFDEEYFQKLVRKVLEIAARIETSLDIRFEWIDLGSGFGVPYEPGESPIDMHHLGKVFRQAFTHPAKLIIEPGRYIVAQSGTILTEVTTVKGKFIGLDASMATLIRPALYDAYHPFILANDPEKENTESYNLVGPVCETTDFFARDRAMPKLQEGNILAIQVSGAYGFVMASRYNGQSFPAEVLIDNEKDFLIRKKETTEDLLRGQL